MDLKNYTPQLSLKEHKIKSADVNRPALQLAGFFEHFEQSRCQIIGNVEYSYIIQMSEEERMARYKEFFRYDIPCVIFCRDYIPGQIILDAAVAQNVPILGTDRSTSEFMAEYFQRHRLHGYAITLDFTPE